MTANKVYAIQEYHFTESDDLFIDANIWIYLYGPQTNPDDWKTKLYSKALDNILKAESRIFIDVLVLSEFINRYARIKYEPIKRSEGIEFKKWRKGAEFKEMAEAIADDSRRIIKRCRLIESGFESIDITAVLRQYKDKCPDFNDQIITELCKSKNMKLVTHDSDFKNVDLTILTCNKKLIN